MNWEVLKQIDTKVHPLNLHLVQKVKDSKVIISDRPSTQIKLLTYNIQMIPKPFQGIYSSGYQEERCLDIIKSFKDFDIVCIQEAWGFCQEIKQLLHGYAQKAGFLYVSDTREPSFASTYLGDSGLMILSRFEIKRKQYIPYSFGVHNDGFTKRGVLYCEIAIGGKQIETNVSNKVHDCATLHLFTTHMQSSYFHPIEEAPGILKQAIHCRTEQVRELSSFVTEQLHENMKCPNDMVVICGDFNLSSRELDARVVKKLLKKNPQFHDLLQDLNLEYRICTELLSQGNKYKIVDMLMNDKMDEYHKLCTFGDYYLNENGKPVAIDQVLTVKEERYSNIILDYMFQLKLNENSGIDFNNKASSKAMLRVCPNSTNIEKFFIKERPYTQLSDHYGISTTLEYLEFSDSEMIKKFD